jgi:general nucleoside transport system permease protein
LEKFKKLTTLSSFFSFRFEKREMPSKWMMWLSPIFAVILSLVLGGFISFGLGLNPLQVYRGMFEGIVQSRLGWSEVLVKLSPILLSGLGVAIAFRASFWNIGAEGQIFMGAIFAFGMASIVGDLPSILAILLVLIAGFVGGGLWGIIPALLKLRFSTNEIVTTLMMNYIAQYALFYLVHGPWKMPQYLYPWSWPIPDSTILPRLFGTRIHLGLLFGLISVVLIYILLKKTFFGYEIKFLGGNIQASRAAGIRVGLTLVLVMLISGGLSGIAGMSEVTGLHYRLKEEISLGYGFAAITAALLGRLNPIGTLFGALVLSILVIGGQYVQRTLSLPFSYVDIIIALVVLFLLIGWQLSNYKIVFQKNERDQWV